MMMVFLVFLGVDEYVIDVNEYKLVEEISKDIVHEILDHARVIWHHQVLVVASGSNESRFPLFPSSDPDQIFSVEVQLGEYYGFSQLIQGGWDGGQWVAELHRDEVETMVVDVRL